ncbi:hypothetical protein EMIT0194P_110062 [Pseudomonas serbica]
MGPLKLRWQASSYKGLRRPLIPCRSWLASEEALTFTAKTQGIEHARIQQDPDRQPR